MRWQRRPWSAALGMAGAAQENADRCGAATGDRLVDGATGGDRTHPIARDARRSVCRRSSCPCAGSVADCPGEAGEPCWSWGVEPVSKFKRPDAVLTGGVRLLDAIRGAIPRIGALDLGFSRGHGCPASVSFFGSLVQY